MRGHGGSEARTGPGQSAATGEGWTGAQHSAVVAASIGGRMKDGLRKKGKRITLGSTSE